MIAVDVTLSVVGLVLMLGASEVMVRNISVLGERTGLRGGALGFAVALGADAPEIATALIALISGSQSIGVGVVEGSNLYNLAGLLGLSSLVVGVLILDRNQLLRDGAANLLVMAAIVLLVLWSTIPPLRIILAVSVVIISAAVFFGHTSSDRHEAQPGPLGRPAAVAIAASLALIGTSWLLVHAVEGLVRETSVPIALFSVFALPVATSIPNTWAAITLARKGNGSAVVSTLFNSNLINLSLGVGVPSLFVGLKPQATAIWFDGPYLLGMTTLTILLLWTASRLSRWEGGAIVCLYAVFLVIRLIVL